MRPWPCHHQPARHGAWLARGLVLWLLSLPLFAAERWQRDDYLLQSFMEVAMKREYGHEAQIRFSRWQAPIRLKLINEFGDKPLQAEVVRVQSQHLARITGHPIEIVSSNPNLTLVMTRHQQMASWAARTMRQDESVRIALKEGICLANFATNGRFVVDGADKPQVGVELAAAETVSIDEPMRR